MYKFFISVFLVLGLCTIAAAQERTKDFKIPLPEHKVKNSLYNKITYLDMRPDTGVWGLVQTGAFNRKAVVIPVIPIQEQIGQVLTALINASAKPGELLLRVRRFSFAEVTSASSEKGYFVLRADMFAKDSGSYRHINTIDTLIVVQSMDVTKELLDDGRQTIADFIDSSLTKRGLELHSYSWNDILHMDSTEKTMLPLYTTSTYTDGLYCTYASFRNQKPDKPVFAQVDSIGIFDIKAPNRKGKLVKVKSKHIYAVVYQGKPYIECGNELYLLKKEGDDFFFKGDVPTKNVSGGTVLAGLFFGMAGALIAESLSDKTEWHEVKIDHRNGDFIILPDTKNKK